MRIPHLHALILTGGYSSRMGMDKCMIDYHGMPQHQYVQSTLQPFTDKVYLSCRREQYIESSAPIIYDAIPDIGPMSGLLASFDQHPDVAWLLIACDMPLVDEHVLRELIGQRDGDKQATYFIDPDTSMPEPLLAIYEPSILPLLQQHAAAQQYSLNRLLQHCNGHVVLPVNKEKLISVNTPEEMQIVLQKMK